jgi:hypothetical protein
MMRENTSGLGPTMSLIGRLGKSCACTGSGSREAASATVIVVIARIKLGRRARAENAVMVFSPAARDFPAARYAVEGLPMSGKVQRASRDKADMVQAPKPIRRVVTGNDAQGRSRVLFDSAAPNVNAGAIVRGTCMTDIWVYRHSPAPISGDRDDGNLPFHFEPPAAGGHLRIVQSPAKPRGYDPARDPAAVPPHPPRRRADGVWDRGGQNAFSSPIHKSETVDYGILLSGERVLVLDSGEIVMKPGDVVVQLGNWHGWTNPSAPSLMAFVMMGATSEE